MCLTVFVARIWGCRKTDSMMGLGRPKRDADEEPCWIIMYHHRSSTDREGSPSQLFQPRHNPTTTLPILLSPPLSPSTCPMSVLLVEKNSDETFLGTENSLPPPCSLLYLHPLPAASVVCCFHRKLARRPPRWISCIARYLPVKVFYGFCIHLLLSVSLALSLSLFLYLSIWPLQLHCHLSLIPSGSSITWGALWVMLESKSDHFTSKSKVSLEPLSGTQYVSSVFFPLFYQNQYFLHHGHLQACHRGDLFMKIAAQSVSPSHCSCHSKQFVGVDILWLCGRLQYKVMPLITTCISSVML